MGLRLISKAEFYYDGSYSAKFTPSFSQKSHYVSAPRHMNPSYVSPQ